MRRLKVFLLFLVVFLMALLTAIPCHCIEYRIGGDEQGHKDRKIDGVGGGDYFEMSKMRNIINLDNCNMANCIKNNNGCIKIVMEPKEEAAKKDNIPAKASAYAEKIGLD